MKMHFSLLIEKFPPLFGSVRCFVYCHFWAFLEGGQNGGVSIFIHPIFHHICYAFRMFPVFLCEYLH